MFLQQLSGLKNLFALIFDNVEPVNKVLDIIQVINTQPKKFYRKENDKDLWGNDFNVYEEKFVSLILNALFDHNTVKRADEYFILEIALRYNCLLLSCLQYINEEYVAPLISRFTNRISTDIKRWLNKMWQNLVKTPSTKLHYINLYAK